MCVLSRHSTPSKCATTNHSTWVRPTSRPSTANLLACIPHPYTHNNIHQGNYPRTPGECLASSLKSPEEVSDLERVWTSRAAHSDVSAANVAPRKRDAFHAFLARYFPGSRTPTLSKTCILCTKDVSSALLPPPVTAGAPKKSSNWPISTSTLSQNTYSQLQKSIGVHQSCTAGNKAIPRMRGIALLAGLLLVCMYSYPVLLWFYWVIYATYKTSWSG